MTRRIAFYVVFALTAVGILQSNSPADEIHFYEFTSDASDSIGTANGTLVNGATVAGGTLNLTAADSEYVQFGSFLVPGSGSYSVALFARQLSVQTGNVELISQSTTGGPGFYIGHFSDASRTIRVGDSWTGTGVSFPNDGDWHHYAVVVDDVGSTTKLYVDGNLEATLGSAITSGGSGTATRFGRQFGTNAEYFDGQLDEVRIYNHALSASDVYTLAVPEPSGLLMALFSFAAVSLGFVRKRDA